MLITYAINKSIIVALDNKANHLVIKIYDQNNNLLDNYEFFQTDFAKIDYQTTEKILFLDIISDGSIERRKLFFN